MTKVRLEGKLKSEASIYADDVASTMPAAPSDISMIDSNVADYMVQNIAKAVLAKSDAEFNQAKSDMLAGISKLNVTQSDKWWSSTWDKAKADFKAAMK